METITPRGKLLAYMRAPIYMVTIFFVGSIFLIWEHRSLGIASLIVTVIYLFITLGVYKGNKKRLSDEIIGFAVQYGTVQSRLLKNFQVPYAILDGEGKMFWMNEQFSELTGKDVRYQKSITSIFKEITRESIERAETDQFVIQVEYEDRIYDAILEKMNFEIEGEDIKQPGDPLLVERSGSLIAVLLQDVTDFEQLKKTNEEEQMVPVFCYVDNYEETMESVDEVKRSMLTAVLDRNISRYFREVDGIIRKIEKDKYFVVLKKKGLQELKENKFSILEDIQTVKIGTDNVFTLSIGIGINGSTYTQRAEYARAAIDMALGRGGSQVVIKDNKDVSYYGVRGREMEKNTRVKARVKAQALREMMEGREKVLVMGHSISDADALGAAVGVYCCARDLGKSCQIVLNTITSSLRPLVETFTEDMGYPRDMFVSSEEALMIVDPDTLVVVVDTNRPNYTECPQLLNRGNGVVVFDHHRQGSEQITNPLLSYIEPYASSACEMITEVLQYFSDDIKINPIEADCIYAGILIDTNNFMTKTGVRTFEAAAYLRRNGAEVTRVRKLLREDMGAYKARAEVVRHAEVYHGSFAISVCNARDTESPTIVGAQAANELLNIVGIKASFVLTEYQKKIFVSSRSIDEIDVQLIMERLGGGGHLNVAGAQIENSSVNEVKRRIEDIIDILIDEGDIKL
ncbi:MAG: DHH family phosphoesterase [Lachnospiraceae bacterium]|nr:DHH family phosphoesterase [Lachnospiraceae bacterium]